MRPAHQFEFDMPGLRGEKVASAGMGGRWKIK